MRTLRKWKEFFLLTALCALVGGLAACAGFAPAAATTPTTIPTPRAIYPEGVDPESIPTPPSELPDPPPTPTPWGEQPTPTLEEIQKAFQEFEEENKDTLWSVEDLRSITLAGRVVDLPGDVKVVGITISIQCAEGRPCAAGELPFYVLERRNSRATVSQKTGRIVYEPTLAPGEEDAFDFIQEALK